MTTVLSKRELKLVAILGCADRGEGSTYYVDFTGGNDGFDGQSPSNAWKTAAKVNGARIYPGDSILFKRGETWAEQLIIPSSGAAGNPIIFSSYGTGALPIFHPEVNVGSAVKVYGCSFVNIYNLNCDGTHTDFAMDIRTSHDVLVSGCTVRNSLNYDNLYVNGTSAQVYNITIEYCTSTNQHVYGGIGIAGNSPTIDGPENVVVRYNSCSASAATVGAHGIYVRFTEGARIYNNTCFTNQSNGINIRDAQNCLVYNNECYSNLVGGIGLCSLTTTTVTGNIIYNNWLHDDLTANFVTQMGATAQTNYVYHNTLVNGRGGSAGGGFQFDSSLSGLIVKNNIIVQDQAVSASSRCYRAGASSLANCVFDYNDLYVPGGTIVAGCDGATYTLANWQLKGAYADPNGIGTNPIFVTDYTDVHIQNASPCKNTGVTGLGILYDRDGYLRDATPDIGAYEYH